MKLFATWAPGLQAADFVENMFLDELDGVVLIDATGKTLRANLTAQTLIGAEAGRLAWSGLPREAATTLTKALRTAQAVAVRVVLDRSPSPLRLRVALLPLHRGALLRVTDYAHEQELEAQLAQSQRLQAVGELAGGIAHDFNNLLTAILGAAEDVLARSDTEADREDLAQICASAARGAALVRQLLAFSRQQTLQPRVIALNDAVRESAKLLQRLLGNRVSLTLELEEPGRLVCIDATQLDQVLMNLALNASHAMPQGGRLTLSTTPHLVLKAEKMGGEDVPPGRYACLMVRDTGSGIPPETLARMFEPFFTTRRDQGGTGLGLSTVYGIVRQSGGYMAAESTVGIGTVFHILLPRHEAQAPWQADPAAHPASQPLASVGRVVLLVDDEAPVRRLAERALRRQGWHVISAACAEEALEAVSGPGEPPALACVISDVVMPGLDGPTLVRRLRERFGQLPAILMSGYADAGLRQSLQCDDIRFLAKPFGMSELTRTAAELVT